jgi:hypothetical protein
MMHELVAFYEARLAEKEACGKAVQATKYGRLALSATAISREVAAARDFMPYEIWGDEMLADVAADRKLIARYKAAVEGHEEALKALQEARKYGGDEEVCYSAAEDVAAAHARASAYLAVLEDRAARFSDHPDYQPHWRQP